MWEQPGIRRSHDTGQLERKNPSGSIWNAWHIGSSVWFDGKRIDSFQNSLSTPHVYELTSAATPGQHTITVRIDNRMRVADVGMDSHSVADHTQGNWNGIIGKISLQLVPDIEIIDVQVYPMVKLKKVRLVLEIKTC